MTDLENNFSIYFNNEGCKLGIDNSLFGREKGNNYLTLNRGTSYGDQELYSGSDEKGVTYRIFWLKNNREFGELHVDDPTYQGIGKRKFIISKDRQFIHV